MEQLIHKGLPHAKGHDVMGDNDLGGQRPKIGDGAAAQHGPHLMGRPRQHQHVDAAAFKGAARARVPTGLSKTVQPSGSSACWVLFSGMGAWMAPS